MDAESPRKKWQEVGLAGRRGRQGIGLKKPAELSGVLTSGGSLRYSSHRKSGVLELFSKGGLRNSLRTWLIDGKSRIERRVV